MSPISRYRRGHELKRRATLLLVTAAVLATAACTSDADPARSPTNAGNAEQPASGPPVTPPPEFVGVKHELPEGEALSNDPDLYETVALEGCEEIRNGWRASGTVENPTSKPIDYRILVFFTDAQARTLDWARARISVAAGRTATWAASRRFEAPDGVRCVVRAVDRQS